VGVFRMARRRGEETRHTVRARRDRHLIRHGTHRPACHRVDLQRAAFVLCDHFDDLSDDRCLPSRRVPRTDDLSARKIASRAKRAVTPRHRRRARGEQYRCCQVFSVVRFEVAAVVQSPHEGRRSQSLARRVLRAVVPDAISSWSRYRRAWSASSLKWDQRPTTSRIDHRH
jgi:hypothetical protein